MLVLLGLLSALTTETFFYRKASVDFHWTTQLYIIEYRILQSANSSQPVTSALTVVGLRGVCKPYLTTVNFIILRYITLYSYVMSL